MNAFQAYLELRDLFPELKWELSSGGNSYTPLTKTVRVNEEDHPASVFHEVGHYVNYKVRSKGNEGDIDSYSIGEDEFLAWVRAKELATQCGVTWLDSWEKHMRECLRTYDVHYKDGRYQVFTTRGARHAASLAAPSFFLVRNEKETVVVKRLVIQGYCPAISLPYIKTENGVVVTEPEDITYGDSVDLYKAGWAEACPLPV